MGTEGSSEGVASTVGGGRRSTENGLRLPGVPAGAGWCLNLYPAAGEAGGCFRSAYGPRPREVGGETADPERSALEAARRARGQVRRYCAANRLNRLGTLTYRGEGCHDPYAFRSHMAAFWRLLRELSGGAPCAYLWTGEWHLSGHGLHAHFAVGRFVPRGLIERAWPHGFVHIKLLGDLPVGSGPVGEARKAAGYLSKYVGKEFDKDLRVPGLHRYEVAQGFQPAVERLWGRSADDVIDLASQRMGHRPDVRWSSADAEQWAGPPAVWVQWPG